MPRGGGAEGWEDSSRHRPREGQVETLVDTNVISEGGIYASGHGWLPVCRATVDVLQAVPCLKTNIFTSPTPNATAPDRAQCMFVTADRLVHSTLQGPCSRLYSSKNVF